MLLALGGGVMAGAVAMFIPVAAAPFVGAAFWAVGLPNPLVLEPGPSDQ